MSDDKKIKRKERLKKKYGDKYKDYLNEELSDDEKEDNNKEITEEKQNQIENTDEQKIEGNINKIKVPDPYMFSPLKACSIEQIFDNLLNLGTSCLKKGGLLVCLYPTKKEKSEGVDE